MKKTLLVAGLLGIGLLVSYALKPTNTEKHLDLSDDKVLVKGDLRAEGAVAEISVKKNLVKKKFIQYLKARQNCFIVLKLLGFC